MTRLQETALTRFFDRFPEEAAGHFVLPTIYLGSLVASVVAAQAITPHLPEGWVPTDDTRPAIMGKLSGATTAAMLLGDTAFAITSSKFESAAISARSLHAALVDYAERHDVGRSVDAAVSLAGELPQAIERMVTAPPGP